MLRTIPFAYATMNAIGCSAVDFYKIGVANNASSAANVCFLVIVKGEAFRNGNTFWAAIDAITAARARNQNT